MRGVLSIVLALAVAAFAQTSAAAATPAYLALGDSLAYGMQIGHLKQELAAGDVTAASFDTGYANLLAQALQARAPGLRLIDLGCPGETTGSFLHGPCAFAASGKPFGTTPLPLHDGYSGAQLAAARAVLADPQHRVRLITLDLGINDLRAVELSCAKAADYDACLQRGFAAAAPQLRGNLRAILRSLRAAAPRAQILVLGYYNWLALQHPGSNAAVRALNRLLAAEAARAQVGFVNVFPEFNGTAAPAQTLCTLTLFCGPTKDLHPSDAGYRVIAQALGRDLHGSLRD